MHSHSIYFVSQEHQTNHRTPDEHLLKKYIWSILLIQPKTSSDCVALLELAVGWKERSRGRTWRVMHKTWWSGLRNLPTATPRVRRRETHTHTHTHTDASLNKSTYVYTLLAFCMHGCIHSFILPLLSWHRLNDIYVDLGHFIKRVKTQMCFGFTVITFDKRWCANSN